MSCFPPSGYHWTRTNPLPRGRLGVSTALSVSEPQGARPPPPLLPPPPPPPPPPPRLPPPSSRSESELKSSSPWIIRTRPNRTEPRYRPETRSWEKSSRWEPSAVGERAMDGGSEPGLAAGERPGLGDAAAAAAASDATGSAIAAVIREWCWSARMTVEWKNCNLEAAECTCLRRHGEPHYQQRRCT